MSLRLAVLAKQVPDTSEVTADAMKADGTVNRSALPTIVNPEDLNALEMALRIRERMGGEVHVLTMGPPAAADLLRDALYRGADRGILITDRRAAASDTLATSYILARAVEHLDEVDLVLCGRQAIDGDTAQVGPQTAEKLGLPQLTYAEDLVEVTPTRLTVRRKMGDAEEVVSAPLPCLVTVTGEANTPRPHGARRLMIYKRARSPLEVEQEMGRDGDPGAVIEHLRSAGLLLEQWDLDEIGADLAWCGRDGSPTKVKRVQGIVLKGEGRTQVEPSREGVRELVHELIVDHTIG
ncbi:MAG: electron transfer flavoprotein subunit beta/FixA family protein [bacterium]